MAISTAQISMDELSTVLTQHIKEQLEKDIKAKLLLQIDPLVSQVARDIAVKTTLNVHSYTSPMSIENPFGPRTILNFSFNNEEINYTTEEYK